MTLQPFDGDISALREVLRLMKNYRRTEFIETGTDLGETSLAMEILLPFGSVYTVESDPKKFKRSHARFLEHEAELDDRFGDSVLFLQDILSLSTAPFIYLDSHVNAWQVEQDPSLVEHYPLREELRVISGFIDTLRPLVMIHDVFNPLHPEYQHDYDHGIRLDETYLKDSFEPFLRAGYRMRYNTRTIGRSPGIGIVYLLP